MKSNLSRQLASAMRQVPLGWVPPNVLGQKGHFRRRVIFDLHGPILNWIGPFYKYASKLYGTDIRAENSRFWWSGYDVGQPITPQQFRDAFIDFSQRKQGGFGDLPAQPGIAKAFKAIHAAGIDTEIWTCVPGANDFDRDTLEANGTGIAQYVTRKLIGKLGLGIDVDKKVRFCKSPDAKLPDMVREPLASPLIIEDHPKTVIEAGMCFGLGAILVPEPYNKDLRAPGVLRLDNREDLAPAVIHYFDQLDKAGCLVA